MQGTPKSTTKLQRIIILGGCFLSSTNRRERYCDSGNLKDGKYFRGLEDVNRKTRIETDRKTKAVNRTGHYIGNEAYFITMLTHFSEGISPLFYNALYFKLGKIK